MTPILLVALTLVARPDTWKKAAAPDTQEKPLYETYETHPLSFVNSSSASATGSWPLHQFAWTNWVRGSDATPPWTATYATLTEVTWIGEIPAGSHAVPAYSTLEVRRPIAEESGSEAWWRVSDSGSYLYNESRQRVKWRHNGAVYFVITPSGPSADS